MLDTALLDHYCRQWGPVHSIERFDCGPMASNFPDFRVAVWEPRVKRSFWTYATCGMSRIHLCGHSDSVDVHLCRHDDPVELHLFAPAEHVCLIELMTFTAHFGMTSAPLGHGHTVNFGRPWLPGSACDFGLLSLPYLDGPKVEWAHLASGTVRCLWLIPITFAERELKRLHGLEALESRFEAEQFNYLDPARSSVALPSE